MKKIISYLFIVILGISIPLIISITVLKNNINYLELVNFKYNDQFESLSSYKTLLTANYTRIITKYNNIINDYLMSNDSNLNINKNELKADINTLIDEYESKTDTTINRNDIDKYIDEGINSFNKEASTIKSNRFINIAINLFYNKILNYIIIFLIFLSIIIIILLNNTKKTLKYLSYSFILSSLILIGFGLILTKNLVNYKFTYLTFINFFGTILTCPVK